MTKTRTLIGFATNPTVPRRESQTRRIQDPESDAFVSRLKEVIGDKKLTWFASECAVGESTLRNILSGAWPRTDLLVRIANAGGVTVDWLATGRPPKHRGGAQTDGTVAPTGATAIVVEEENPHRAMLEQVISMIERRLASGNIEPRMVSAAQRSAPAWLESAGFYPELVARLRSVIAALDFIQTADEE